MDAHVDDAMEEYDEEAELARAMALSLAPRRDASAPSPPRDASAPSARRQRSSPSVATPPMGGAGANECRGGTGASWARADRRDVIVLDDSPSPPPPRTAAWAQPTSLAAEPSGAADSSDDSDPEFEALAERLLRRARPASARCPGAAEATLPLGGAASAHTRAGTGAD